MIASFLSFFLILVLLYHILTTVVGFWFFWGAFPQLPALLRDGIWIVFFLISTISFRKYLPGYRKRWKWARISFLILCVFSLILSRFKDKSFYDMFVWFKYGFQYISFFLMASVLGWISAKQDTAWHLKSLFYKIPFVLSSVVLLGFIWQGAKLLWPDLFFSLGYGPLDDFHFWDKPPLYYLTWLGGTLRWQWIFSWPNNYWYFLVAFLPLILASFPINLSGRKSLFSKQNSINIMISLLWFIAIFATLSRTAIIGMIIVLALVKFGRWKNHKKRAYVFWWIVLLGIIGLSLLKWSSTIAHLHAKLWSLSYVFQHPWWYWLGTSGPAIHHNWTILPENYFIQLLLDIGRIGFLLWTGTIVFCSKLYLKTLSFLKQQNILHAETLRAYGIGFITLLIMWIFLHVFEDSMINYMFFVLLGTYLGYIQNKKANR